MNALTKHEPVEMAVDRPREFDLEGLFRLTLEKGGGVETMERLMVIRREVKAEQAKAAFDCALAAFQSECPIIEKRKTVFNKGSTTVRYKYAPLDDIIAQVKGLLQKHRFSYSLNTENKPGFVKAICKLKHEEGHHELSEFEIPIDKEAFMNCQQQFASALTFAKRYTFCNALGIMTGDEDNDTNNKRDKPAGPSSIAGEKPLTGQEKANKQKLVDLTRNIHGCKGYNLTPEGKEKLLAWLIDEAIVDPADTLESLFGTKLSTAIERLERKLKA
jgi:hypothetical protein